MNPLRTALLVLLLGLCGACANRSTPQPDPQPVDSDSSLVGQVLLPGGFARRGIEVHATVTTLEGEARDAWLLFDQQGRFSHDFQGRLANLTVVTGGGTEVYRAGAEELNAAHPPTQIDLGVIDLRQRLTIHRHLLSAAEGTPMEVVRVAMWHAPPPVGPHGGNVSLGSRQFPQVALGSQQEWLMPMDKQPVYFLVERPDGPGRGRDWRSGHQRLFGPFNPNELPTELVMD